MSLDKPEQNHHEKEEPKHAESIDLRAAIQQDSRIGFQLANPVDRSKLIPNLESKGFLPNFKLTDGLPDLFSEQQTIPEALKVSPDKKTEQVVSSPAASKPTDFDLGMVLIEVAIALQIGQAVGMAYKIARDWRTSQRAERPGSQLEHEVDQSADVRAAVDGNANTGKLELQRLAGDADPSVKDIASKTLAAGNTAAAGPGDKRPPRELPRLERLATTDTNFSADGTVVSKDTAAGSLKASEKREDRSLVSEEEIGEMRKLAAKQENSDNALERQNAAALKETIAALEGKSGPAKQAEAHRLVLEESRKTLELRETGRLAERGSGTGRATAVKGGIIGVAILAVAALSYYNRLQRHAEEQSLQRAKVK